MKNTPLKLTLVFSFFFLSACDELQQVVNQIPNQGPVTEVEIAAALKAALQQGIDQRVDDLAAEGGYFNNPLVRIGLPSELQKVDKTLRDIGLSKLADEGLKVLNRAAEDAVSEAIPVFVNAVSGITFADAKNILLGDELAATTFLEGRTEQELYNKFFPIIKNSFEKVGADVIWEDLITRYNQLPLTRDVDPDLSAYVTGEALNGVYKVIGEEEKEIRSKVSARGTRLLQRVFALQDRQ